MITVLEETYTYYFPGDIFKNEQDEYFLLYCDNIPSDSKPDISFSYFSFISIDSGRRVGNTIRLINKDKISTDNFSAMANTDFKPETLIKINTFYGY